MPAIAAQLTYASSWVVRSIRRRGIRATAAVAISSLEDLTFDWRNGTDTRRVIHKTTLEDGLPNRDHAFSYQPSKEQPFFELMRRLPLPENSTLVDVGCGLGKVLLLASQLASLRRVIGLEFSPRLCEQARRNIEIFQKSGKARIPMELVEGDAAQRVPGPDENIFFLYNPFDAQVLGAFLDRVRDSLAAHPRKVWLIYSVPLHAHVIDDSPHFARTETLRLAGNEVFVYTSVPASKSTQAAYTGV